MVSLLPLWRGPGDTVVTGVGAVVVRIAQRLKQVSTRVILEADTAAHDYPVAIDWCHRGANIALCTNHIVL